jgi:hypothetical protein
MSMLCCGILKCLIVDDVDDVDVDDVDDVDVDDVEETKQMAVKHRV